MWFVMCVCVCVMHDAEMAAARTRAVQLCGAAPGCVACTWLSTRVCEQLRTGLFRFSVGWGAWDWVG